MIECDFERRYIGCWVRFGWGVNVGFAAAAKRVDRRCGAVIGVAFPRLDDGVLQSINTVELTHFACLAFCNVSYEEKKTKNRMLDYNQLAIFSKQTTFKTKL